MLHLLGLGSFCAGGASDPQLLHAEAEAGAEAEAVICTAATLTPLLAMGLEQLLLRSSHVPSLQEAARVRELSIQLFQHIMEIAVGTQEEQMKKHVHSCLLPLLVHAHEEIPSVAQVCVRICWLCGARIVSSIGQLCPAGPQHWCR